MESVSEGPTCTHVSADQVMQHSWESGQKRSQVWLHFSNVDRDNAICSICYAKWKVGHGNSCKSVKAEECNIFDHLKVKSPAAAPNVSSIRS